MDKLIKAATVSGWGMDLMRDKNGYYFVAEYDPSGEPIEDMSLDGVSKDTPVDEAIVVFDKYIAEQRERADSEEPAPDWEAQARYDEAHGTINGEDAGIVAMRELWGE